MAKERIPAEVWPLASYLAEEMKERGWDSWDVATRMNTGRQFAVDLFCVEATLCIEDDGLIIDDATFNGLALAFGVDTRFFRNLDAIWRKHPDRRVIFECPDALLHGAIITSSLPPPVKSQS